MDTNYNSDSMLWLVHKVFDKDEDVWLASALITLLSWHILESCSCSLYPQFLSCHHTTLITTTMWCHILPSLTLFTFTLSTPTGLQEWDLPTVYLKTGCRWQTAKTLVMILLYDYLNKQHIVLHLVVYWLREHILLYTTTAILYYWYVWYVPNWWALNWPGMMVICVW